MPSPTARRAHTTALAIATLLEDPAEVSAQVARPENVVSLPDGRIVPYWTPASLGIGHAGVALFFGELSRHDARWLAAARNHLRTAAEHVADIADTPGLLDGLAGLGYAATAVARSPADCRNLLGACNREIERLANAIAGTVGRNVDGLHHRHYDVVSGHAGILRYALRLRPADSPLAEQSLSFLLDVAAPRRVDGADVPGWWAFRNPAFGPVTEDLGDRAFDVGMAHGAAGLLASLAVASRSAPGREDLLRAVNYTADWLLDTRGADAAPDAGWPSYVTYSEQVDPDAVSVDRDRSAWCYGTPGVAAGLILAARAAGRSDLERHAIGALERAVASTPPSDVPGVGLCHGLSGLALVAHVVGRRGRSAALADFAAHAVDELCERFSTGNRFGLRNEGTRVGALPDDPGLLGGAAGVGLMLLGYPSEEVSSTGWEGAVLVG